LIRHLLAASSAVQTDGAVIAKRSNTVSLAISPTGMSKFRLAVYGDGEVSLSLAANLLVFGISTEFTTRGGSGRVQHLEPGHAGCATLHPA